MDNSGLIIARIGDEDFSFRFGMPANRIFFEKMTSGASLIVGDKINETGVATLLHAGYLNQCLVKDVTPVKTLGFFIEYVEECLVDEDAGSVLKAIVKCWENSKFTDKTLDNIKKAVDDTKKKLNGI